MTDPTIPFAIAGSAVFGVGIISLVWRIRGYAPARPWSDFKDRVNTVPESYAEAIQMIAANSDKPIMTYGDWPSITEEEAVKLHGGVGK